jgi:hypothetical protein
LFAVPPLQWDYYRKDLGPRHAHVERNAMDNGDLKYVLAALAFFLVFLPIIVAETRGRMALVFAAFILSVLPVGLVAVSLACGAIL